MRAREVNFTFNGLHCMRDFGCIYIASGKARTVAPAMVRNTYEIAGVSGTVLLGELETYEPYKLSGTLVPMQTPRTMAAAQDLARRLSAWLQRGRGELCWDYEPFHLHYAEVISATSWETKTWMDGGLAFDFLVQPGTYNLTPTAAQMTITGGKGELYIPVSTVLPCPVDIELINRGDQQVSHVKCTTPDGHVVELGKSMELQPGDELYLTMHPPIGATIRSNGSEINALQFAEKFDPLTLSAPGSICIEADGLVSVKAVARGRMQ